MKFLREVFSDGGQGSYSRLASGAVVLATLFWVSYLVIKNHSMPDLGGPSLLIGTSSTAHYGVNQIQNIVGMLKGTGNAPTDTH